ncbi:MAG TPA: tetratricopeptide repeat protein [Candidatus Polarisedimenticolia bacterium]|nr:tetratricopeptide repeat protein [Candidatus Polarisedimenticolia bacterium]
MKPSRLAWCLLPALLAAPACASRAAVQGLQRQIDQLERQNFELRKQLAEARVRLEMAAEAGGGADPGAHRAARPQEEASPSEAPLSRTARGESATVYSEPITDASRYTSGPLIGRAAGGQAAPAPGGRPASGPSGLIHAARAELDAHRPDAAMVLFQQLVSAHPGDALADDAQYGIGECHFQMERYEEAIGAYRKVGELFPYGDQVPAAMLKIAFSHLALEQRPEAMETFRTVSESYPGTEAATVARQQMAHLKASSR